MFYHLPPAGNSIIWNPSSTSLMDVRKRFRPYEAYFYNSGAESLTAAIVSIVAQKNIVEPEVILSAYSCPELVSAILHAGAKPILVDLEHQRPWINIDDLGHKITKNTVAVIAVNLFGIAEQLERIIGFCHQHDIFLIEDSAQSLPDTNDKQFWHGDFIVLSFGRGKPVSTLGGGALLCRDKAELNSFYSENSSEKNNARKHSKIYRLKIFLYNMLLHPRLYFIPNSLPFLKLGQTRFKPLAGIKPMEAENVSILEANIDKYIKTRTHENQQGLSDIISGSNLIDLAKVCAEAGTPPNLLRFPVLCNSRQQRDDLYTSLNKAGLGASKMYQQPLNKIDGLEEIFQSQGDFPHATEFAETLLTLPVHKGLTLRCMEKIKQHIQ